MPIRKKDRSFQNIIRDVEMDTIPMEYVQQLVLVLQNGDRIIFNGDDLQDIDEDNIVLFLMSAIEELGEEHHSPVENLEIIVDYKRLEKEIISQTNQLLNKNQ